MVRRLHTPAGLKYGSYGMLLEIIVAILAIIMLIPLVSISDPADISPGTLALIGGMACLIGILGVVAIIFWILLLYEMHVGKREFGPKHTSRVSLGIILVIMGIVLIVIAIIVTFAAVLAGIEITGDTYEIDAAQYRFAAAISAVFSIASAIALNLALVYFALEIIDVEKRNFLWMALAATIIAPIVSAIITIAGLPTSGTIESTEVDALAPWANVAEIFGLIGTALFFVSYRAARQRILDGRILPVGLQPVPPPQYPPQYPPPQAWGQQPPPATSEEPPKWDELEPVEEPEE
jgi:magnesium-transporting ATPase (P-type)